MIIADPQAMKQILVSNCKNYIKPPSRMTYVNVVFTPQPLMAVGVLFSPMVSGWACISETIRCRKLVRGRDIGYGV